MLLVSKLLRLDGRQVAVAEYAPLCRQRARRKNPPCCRLRGRPAAATSNALLGASTPGSLCPPAALAAAAAAAAL